MIDHITQTLPHPTRVLQVQSRVLMSTRKKAMRRFGRQCRGQGRVLVTVVRQSARHLLAIGKPLVTWAHQAHAHLQRATAISPATRERLASQRQTALERHHHIEAQSRKLTQGKRLAHRKIVSASDDTIAPIIKGKSNCATPCGRKPGLVSAPTIGFIFAMHLPAGNPDDASSVLPLIDRTQAAIDRLKRSRAVAIHSVGGDLGLNAPTVRQALHQRSILTVGIPTRIDPINAAPDPEQIATILAQSGLAGTRTAHQVELASASGYSRPVVESHMATLQSRGASHLRYRGPRGAQVQLGMTVMAHNGAALVRVSHQPLSNRAQTFRQKLRLRNPKANKINRRIN
jgi:hypothetical protein